MNAYDLKEQMMKLWKDTFHDSDDYISLIFDNYFDPEYIEYHEENGQLVSALLGIPYLFGNKDLEISAIYLCGLATKTEFRNRGIMDNLIKRINGRARVKGYILSFLIPQSDVLRIYYLSKGYHNFTYYVEDRYTNVHNFRNEYIANIDKSSEKDVSLKVKAFEKLRIERLTSSDYNLLQKVTDYILSNERKQSDYLTLIHRPEDLEIVLKENAISNGEIYICINSDDKISGVAFITFNESKRITILRLFNDDNTSYYKILEEINKKYPNSPICIKRFPEETHRKTLLEMEDGMPQEKNDCIGGSYGFTERVYDVNRHAKPYGMCKILDYCEILKILAESRKDCKFSILVKDPKSSNQLLKCNVSYGEIRFESIEGNEREIISSNSPIMLNTHDLSELIFRKKDSSNILMEALGIPRLAMNMSLLLD